LQNKVRWYKPVSSSSGVDLEQTSTLVVCQKISPRTHCSDPRQWLSVALARLGDPLDVVLKMLLLSQCKPLTSFLFHTYNNRELLQSASMVLPLQDKSQLPVVICPENLLTRSFGMLHDSAEAITPIAGLCIVSAVAEHCSHILVG